MKLIVHAHLISGVGHVEFGTFLRAVRVSQLHVEQVEDETIKSRAQPVTEAPNSSNHPLNNTYRYKQNTVRKVSNRCYISVANQIILVLMLILLNRKTVMDVNS